MPSILPPGTPLTLGLMAAAVVAVAFAVGHFQPARRKRLRRLVVPYVAHVLSLVAALIIAAAGGGGAWTSVPLHLAWLFEMLVWINLGAMVLFDLALPGARVRVPNLVHELALGAAYVVVLFAFLRSQGVNPSSLVATSAVVTAILAFSMQATLGNVLGGVALQLDDSIHVGDWIRLDPQTEGLVKEIRWRHTVVETRNWDTIIVPNSTLLAQNITILGKRDGEPTQHRMWVHFNVDFRYAPAEVIDAVEIGLRAAPIPGVAQDPPPNCVCLDFAQAGRDSFAHYAVRYWLTDLAADDPTSSAVRVRLYAALRRAGIPLAVPAATVFVAQDDVQRAERKAERDFKRRDEALASVELFAPMTADERQQLARRLRFAPFAQGEVITREGAEAHWLYILHRGRVEVRVGVDGHQVAVGELTAPAFFGEQGLMTGEPRSATVVALTEVECYRLDKAAFQNILQTRPEVARDLSVILAERQQGLIAARAALDARVRAPMAADESKQILRKIQRFFGLDERG